MAAQPDVLLACYQSVASAARPAFERCVEHAIAELQTLETHSLRLAERDALVESWRYLQSHKTVWARRYADDLLVEFTKPIPTRLALDTGINSQVIPSGFASLGLVNDADLKQKIDAQRLLQDLLPATESALTDLDALVSSALGLSHVAPERNPLRPEIFTRTLQQLMGTSLEDAAATQLSIRHMAKPLGRELNFLYKQAVKALTQANIPAASYQYRVKLAALVPPKAQGLAAQQDASNNTGLAGDAPDARRPDALANLAAFKASSSNTGSGMVYRASSAAPSLFNEQAQLAAYPPLTDLSARSVRQAP